jgi:uncharacterized protein YggE
MVEVSSIQIAGFVIAILIALLVWKFIDCDSSCDTSEEKQKLTVTGKGTVEVEQDEVRINANIKDAKENVEDVQSKAAVIKSKFESESSVKDIEISFRNQQEYDSEKKKYVDTYFVSDIRFIVTEERATAMQDFLIANGATIGYTSFDISTDKRQAAENQAIEKATQDATDKIEATMKAYGSDAKYKIVNVQLQQTNFPYFPMMADGAVKMSADEGSSELISSGTREVTSSVMVTAEVSY